MNDLPKKCLVDTNVPKTANLAIDPLKISDELMPCVSACVKAIEHVIKKGGLVLDAGDEIFTEYRRQLSLKGQPGLGDRFMKWVHDNRWKFPDTDRVTITWNGESYDEFPNHNELINFDTSDRKFVAVANAHPEKPPILPRQIANGGVGKMLWLISGLPYSFSALPTPKPNTGRRWKHE
jgi:hypothetical protein